MKRRTRVVLPFVIVGRSGRPIRRLQRWSMELAPEHCHFMAQHHDLNGEIGIAELGEPDELEDAAERLVE